MQFPSKGVLIKEGRMETIVWEPLPECKIQWKQIEVQEWMNKYQYIKLGVVSVSIERNKVVII